MVDLVGNTPMVKIEDPEINLYAKLEGYNLSGSVKDRAANYIIDNLLMNRVINKDTTIIESSSGNFGIALATYCNRKGLRFICVIDINIQKENECILHHLGAEIVKIDIPDENGGYLMNRLKKVSELKKQIENSYWINQYENVLNWESYYNTLGLEICNQITNIDYIFLGVSSGGTITGVSRRVKEHNPNCKVIAVDTEGSVIFGSPPKTRHISGIGSSIIPISLKSAKIDEIMIVNEEDTINMCRYLLRQYGLLIGGSSGAVYTAVRKYFDIHKTVQNPNVVVVFADRGDRYLNTVYNDEWVQKIRTENYKKIHNNGGSNE